MRGAAAAMAASSGPPRSYTVASERPASGAGGCWPPAAPAPGAELTLISDVLASSRAQPESRRAVNSRARERVGDGGADLAQRGVGRPRARPALGGAAGRLGARAVALKQPKIAAAGIGDLQSASLRPVRAAARLSRGSPACPGAVLTRGAERGAAAVEPGPWRLRDEPNRAPRRWRSNSRRQLRAAARHRHSASAWLGLGYHNLLTRAQRVCSARWAVTAEKLLFRHNRVPLSAERGSSLIFLILSAIIVGSRGAFAC